MEIPTLRTERLLLRPFRAADFDSYAAMNGSVEVMRYIRDTEDRAAAFRSFCAVIGHWTARGYGMWALEETARGAFLGTAGLVRWEGRPAVEIGYALAPAAWGKGYATEAVREALRWAREVVGARGLTAVIHPDNAPSIKVAERLGATRSGALAVKDQSLLVYSFADSMADPSAT